MSYYADMENSSLHSLRFLLSQVPIGNTPTIQMSLSKVANFLDSLNQLNVNEKYTVYICLLNDLKKNEDLLVTYCQNVHSLDYLKNLLNCKKEQAIENLVTILPLLKIRDVQAKNLIFKILPVLFSYVTLYDTEIDRIFQIVEIIRVHPAFSQDQKLFRQWFHIFDKRLNNIEKKFQYKDEFYVQDLPSLQVDAHCPFSLCIGYADVGLLRTVHRWLRILRLHKYLYFFANLTYNEIVSITPSNIQYFEAIVGVSDMTVGARNKILREVEELRNRSARLKSIIYKNRYNPANLEDAAREIKRIMRSPISANAESNLPLLLVDTLKKISQTVYSLVGSSEKMIPLYGLIISILKEAYNYSFFNNEQKDHFNLWRSHLSSKINTNGLRYQTSKITIMKRIPDDIDDDEEDFSSDSLSPIELNTEVIATRMANFVLS